MTCIGLAPTEGDERQLAVRQKGYPGIVAPGSRNHQAIDEAARYHPLEIFLGVLLRGAEKRHQVQLVTVEDRLQTVKDAHEESIALTRARVTGLDDETDRAGDAAAQAAAEVICEIAELCRGQPDPFPRFDAGVRPPVERAGDRADRHAEVAGDVSDADERLGAHWLSQKSPDEDDFKGLWGHDWPRPRFLAYSPVERFDDRRLSRSGGRALSRPRSAKGLTRAPTGPPFSEPWPWPWVDVCNTP